ncbi:MAG: squalene/phytoene synthase family protein [Rhodobiaceae bacterium]|nr:squalene/phytoene synthase family protein [Rhodobiaceae bacterium]MCC0057043.1 squalene/phytoene synthase family protein [Rhodobiaceae bacterium]
MQDDLKVCAAQLRAVDFDRYIAAAMAPSHARPDLTALYCFHHEIGRIADIISEPLPGEIRLQWWRDAIAGEGHGDVSGNPVAALLLAAIDRGTIAADDLQAMIDARAAALYAEPPATMDETERRLSATSGALLRTAGGILTGEGWQTIERAARAGGLTEGLVGLVRNLGYDASHGRIALPLDLLAEHNVHTGDLLAGREPEGLRAALASVLDRASECLGIFRRESSGLPRTVLPAFAGLALVRRRIAMLRKPRLLLASPPEMTPLGVVVRIWFGRHRRYC